MKKNLRRRCVFLDRDGVITSGININVADETRLVPGAKEAIAKLKSAGFLVICVTNQGGIGENLDGSVRWKGRPLTREALAAIHVRLAELLGDCAKLDAIKFCPHSKSVVCPCRKPAAGMITEAAAEFDVDLAASFMVGDRASDIQAGVNAGTTNILVLTGPDGDQTTEKDGLPAGTKVVPSIVEAADYILSLGSSVPAALPADPAGERTMSASDLVKEVARAEGAKSAVIMVGVPASGKSTFCDPLVAEGYERHNMDAIRLELFGDEGIIGDEKGAKLVRDTFRKRLEESLAAGKRVLIDNTNFNQRTRQPVLDRLAAAGYTDVQLLILDVPLDECLRRNAARARVVGEDFIRMAFAQLHGNGWPTSKEGKLIVIKPGKTRNEFKVSFPS